MPAQTKYTLSQEEVRFWISEIESCVERQKNELIKRNCYPFLIKYYEGEMWPNENQHSKSSQEKMCFINEYFPNTNQLLNEILYQYPEINPSATKPDSEEGIPIMKGAINYAMKKLDSLTEFKLSLFDMIMAGYCGVEVNHINITPTEPFIKPEPIAKQENFLSGAIQKVKEVVGLAKPEEKLAQESEVREMSYATQDETYLCRVNPLDIPLDYRAERIKDRRYQLKRIKLSYAEFAARYPNFKDQIQADDVITGSEHKDQSYKRAITLWNVQVKKQGNKYINYIISRGFPFGELEAYERQFVTNGFDIKIGTLDEYGVLYPISRAKINKAVQDDINNYATFMMEVAERNIPKIGYNLNNVKGDGLVALKSDRVNDLVGCNGGQDNVWTVSPTKVSVENKELLAIFGEQKEKLWSVSKQRLGQKGGEDFATELQIQEAGFERGLTGLQLSLKKLWLECADTVKDIIVQFWDKPYWFKITGKDRPSWYEPQVDPNTGKVLNPLTDILTGDYELDLDLITAMRPNKEKQKKDTVEFATWITSPNVTQFCASQGYAIDIDVIRKVIERFDLNADNLLKELPPPEPMMGAMPGQEMMPGQEQLPPQGQDAQLPV